MLGTFSLLQFLDKLIFAGSIVQLFFSLTTALILGLALYRIQKVVGAYHKKKSSCLREMARQKMLTVHILFLAIFIIAALVISIFGFSLNLINSEGIVN